MDAVIVTPAVYTGTIIAVDTSTRWGFVRADSGEEHFWHASKCNPGFHPKLGDDVNFQLGNPFKVGQRPQAINIRPLRATQSAETVAAMLSLGSKS
jgi:cold shock CspA family protein